MRPSTVCLFAFLMAAPALGLVCPREALAQKSSAPTGFASSPLSPPSGPAQAPVATVQAAGAARDPAPDEREQAVKLARDGQYDKALDILERLHGQDIHNLKVSRDMAVILAWAGRNQEAVALYETLPLDEPDYVVETIGRAYRALGQTDKALAAYRLGLRQSPDNVQFAEGEARCLADMGKLDDALAAVNADIGKHGARPEILATQKDILQSIDRRDELKAVEMGRAGRYKEALAILSDLHLWHPDDVKVTQDYLCVMSWAGGRDEQVVALYKTLPAGDQPDYVLGVVGHSYRQLKRFAQAQTIYEQALRQHPDSAVFAEGVIRSLVDQKKYNAALALADKNLRAYGNRPQIVDIRKNILRLKTPGQKKPRLFFHFVKP